MTGTVEIELKSQIAGSTWQRLIESHWATNSVLSTRWLESTNEEMPYYRGAIVGAANAITHYKLKWWENNIPSETQLKFDLIGILYNALSDHMRLVNIESSPHSQSFDLVEETARHLCSIQSGKKRFNRVGTALINDPDRSYQINTVELLELFIAETLKEGLCNMSVLAACFESIEVEPNEITGMYFGGKALKAFRARNNKEPYDMMWGETEDYMVLQEYIEEHAPKGMFFTVESLLLALNELYTEKTGKTLA